MGYRKLYQRAAGVTAALATGILVWLVPGQAAFAQTITATEGAQFSGQITSVTATCTPVTSPAGTIDWGDGTADSAASIAVSGSQLLISGTHTYAAAGSYSGSISGEWICDGDKVPFTATFEAQVADAPLTMHAGNKLAANPTDHSFSGQVALFTDPASHAASGYTATINWGDNSSSTGTVTPCAGTFCVGTFDVSGSHQYGLAAKTYTVTVTVVDDVGGASATGTDTMSVVTQLHCPATQSWGGNYSGYPLGNLYQLGSPQSVLDANGNPTGQVTQTLWIGRIAAVTPGCWYAVGDADPPANSTGPPVIHFLTYSGVAINGVYFMPHSPDSALVVGSDGTVVAENWCGLLPIKEAGSIRPLAEAVASAGCNASTYYDVEVPENGPDGGPLVTVGQVDLRANWITNYNTSLGSFGPAPNGPAIGTHTINPGATITNPAYPAQYAAQLNAAVNLPGEFSLTPGNGVPGAGDKPTTGLPVTSTLTYYTQGPKLGNSSGGGGGGGSGGEAPCLVHLPPDCPPIHVEIARPAARGAAPASRTHVLAWDPAAASPPAARTLTAAGFSCPPVTLAAPQLFLGGLEIDNASLTCDSSDPQYPWTGTGELNMSQFPGGQALPDVDLKFQLAANGSFHSGSATLTFPYPGAPVFASPPVNLVSLSISFATRPTDFDGTASVNIADGLVTINGGVLVVNADNHDPYVYPTTSCDQDEPCPPLPGVASLQLGRTPITTFAAGVAGTVTLGQVPVLGSINLASGYVFYVYPSYFEFGGHLGPISLLGGFLTANGGLEGAANLALSQYDITGQITACANFPSPIGSICPYLQAEVSNVGLGGCGGIHAFGTDWGLYAWLKWKGGDSIGFGGCDNIWPIHVSVQSTATGRTTGGHPTTAGSFTLPAGLSSASVTVSGSGGAPLVAIAGPAGEKLSDPTANQAAAASQIMIVPVTKLKQTLIAIKHPAAGKWTITPLAGSPAITGIDYTHSLPPLHAATSVTRAAGGWALRYSFPAERDQSITFVERSHGVFHVLGHASGGHGTLHFTPAPGPAGHRQIVAVIAENGLPVRTQLVGHYTAPPIPRAGPVSHLQITRTKRALLVRWGAAGDAHGYLVTARLTDGRSLSYTRAARDRSIAIKTYAPGTGATVTVYGLGPTGSLGKPVTARLAPPPAPARVTGIHVRRTKHGLVITWRPAARAFRYLVKVTISGSVHTVLFAFTDRPSLTPKNANLMLRAGATSLISVTGVSVEGRQGKPGALRYKAGGKSRRSVDRAAAGQLVPLIE